jgi:predicted tellurium resistance membrane protein TerC
MRMVLFIQGVYYVITGVWPLVSIETFEAVTGPKTDDWLVQTVGVLAAVIGATLLVGTLRRVPSRETLTLSVLSILGFMAVDIVFVLQGIIGPIYLADAVIQAVFLIGLGVGYARRRSQPLSG